MSIFMVIDTIPLDGWQGFGNVRNNIEFFYIKI